MLGRLLGKCRISQTRRTVRGSVMPIFAAMSIPMLMSVGVGVDMTRLTLARSALQSAVDGAALAGAAAGGYSNTASSAKDNAIAAANAYFSGNYSHGGQGPAVTLTATQTVTPTNTGTGYQVYVSAQGNISTAFLGIASLVVGSTSSSGITTMPVVAHATANNLILPGSSPTVVINSGNVNANAGDWNSAYLYSVPFLTDGVTPNWTYIPQGSELYQLGTNCPATGGFCNSSAGQSCSVVSASTSPPIPAPNQPLAILMINVTGGLSSYVQNSYGAQQNSCQIFRTALLGNGQSPSQFADSAVLQHHRHEASSLPPCTGDSAQVTPACLFSVINATAIAANTVSAYTAPNNPTTNTAQTTTYSTVNGSTLNNCSVMIQIIDPNAVPVNPPYSGSCFSSTDLTDTQSGNQFANISCAQMAGRTFMYWFNDMGGYKTNDNDYNDLSFSFRCKSSSIAATALGSTKTTVSLLK